MSLLKNSLFGFIVGDAMGVPIEFESREYLKTKPVKQMIGYGTYDEPAGTWSDDTSMTLATTSSIIEKQKIDYHDIMLKFCEWVNNSKFTATNHLFDIGGTTSYAINRFKSKNIEPTQCGGKSEYENGNGSLMRMLPIALYTSYNNLDEGELYEIIKNTSSLTHAHEISIMGCYIYVKFIHKLIETNDLFESYKYIQTINYINRFSNHTISLYNRIIENDINLLNEDEINSSGFIVHTLEAVLWVSLNTTNYKDSIIKAINLGKDTDTIGAIAGSVTGLKYGYENIPSEWINQLQKKEYINSIIEQWDKFYK